ncbi:MAG: DinB family protein [Candidatus Marinimicrobia bacterium]|nr:DinB family protein [Candidatus Neomarinimicrobiota bacterium]
MGLSLRTVESVERDLKKVRKETLELVEMIPEDFLFNPPKPYMGPIIWDLVHIGKF